MPKLNNLKKHLRRGHVYRRGDLSNWSTDVDRDLRELVQQGVLQKLFRGTYYYPKTSRFGAVPPDDQLLIRSFLKNDPFLLTSPNLYNSLGPGTTQLYNLRIVYNHKRNGEFNFGNRRFEFRIRARFPKKLTPEFLLIDMINNLPQLAEEADMIINKLPDKVKKMDKKKLAEAVANYGNAITRKIFESYF